MVGVFTAAPNKQPLTQYTCTHIHHSLQKRNKKQKNNISHQRLIYIYRSGIQPTTIFFCFFFSSKLVTMPRKTSPYHKRIIFQWAIKKQQKQKCFSRIISCHLMRASLRMSLVIDEQQTIEYDTNERRKIYENRYFKLIYLSRLEEKRVVFILDLFSVKLLFIVHRIWIRWYGFSFYLLVQPGTFLWRNTNS